ncbi:MAG: hypothetical protein NVSMB38_05450 [Ktedonobacteraceae bacterium]
MPDLSFNMADELSEAVTLAQTKTTYHVSSENKVTHMVMQPVVGGGLEGLLQQVGAELPLAPRCVNFRE